MDEKKIIYEIILSIWNLFKKCGFQKLTDEQWEILIEEVNKERNKLIEVGNEYDLLYRDLFNAVQNFYERKKK